MMATNTVSRQTAVNKLIRVLVPSWSNAGKQKEMVIDSELMPLYEQAHQKTDRILSELPMRLRRANDDKEFATVIYDYQQLYKKYKSNGDLAKLEVLTASFDIIGALDLLALKVNVNMLVAYTLQGQCQFGIPREHQITFEFYVRSNRTAPKLFETPGIKFDELRNYYTYCVPLQGQSYWVCSSTGWYYSPRSYCFITNKRRLTTPEMWLEIDEAHKQRHSLRDEEGNPLTRKQLRNSLAA